MTVAVFVTLKPQDGEVLVGIYELMMVLLLMKVLVVVVVGCWCWC